MPELELRLNVRQTRTCVVELNRSIFASAFERVQRMRHFQNTLSAKFTYRAAPT